MLQSRIVAFVLIYVVTLAFATCSASELRTEGRFCLRRVAEGFHRPVALELYGEHVFVAEHQGIIRRVDLDTGLHTMAADISTRLLTSTSWMDHRGLLSLRFVGSRSEATSTGREGIPQTLLISSSRKSHDDADHDTVVTAVPVTSQGEILIANEYELMRVAQPSDRYNGGQLLSRRGQFVNGNNLNKDAVYEQIVYLTTGDGAMKLNESTRFNETKLTGKILRMILTEDISTENERSASHSKFRISLSKPEIFAVGFRNPWRCAIDTRTSTTAAGVEKLFCGDTAIEPHPQEEIFLVRKGGRYGHPDGGTPNDEKPIYEYQLPTGSAVIGGTVYRGKTFDDMKNSFIFGDYVSGGIYALAEKSDGWKVDQLPLKWCSDKKVATSNDNLRSEQPDIHVVAFAENREGELLVLAEDKTKSGLWRGAIFSLEMNSTSTYIRAPLFFLQAISFLTLYWAISKF